MLNFIQIGGEAFVSIIKVGTITHYYPKIGVAVVDLTGTLNLGDRVHISGSADFIQQVDSLQMEHQQVRVGKAGDTVGLKIDQAAKVGDILSTVL